ncbi:MAG: DUF2953 domain-containing protein [Clostridia bacterium]|nr:DUF2953 domain-containing protein [Clostridia bacterium]
MTALWIILGIIAFIFVLLICPLAVSVVYDGELELKIRYLFLCFKILPPKEKKPKEPKPQKAEKSEKSDTKPENKNQNQIKDFIKKKGTDGLIELLKKIVDIIPKATKTITSHLVISKLDINVLVVGDDAADTAMKFGYLCSAVYPIVSMIESNIKKCKHNENIVAGFNDSETKIYLVLKARIKPLFLISAALRALFRGIKAIAK